MLETFENQKSCKENKAFVTYALATALTINLLLNQKSESREGGRVRGEGEAGEIRLKHHELLNRA